MIANRLDRGTLPIYSHAPHDTYSNKSALPDMDRSVLPISTSRSDQGNWNEAFIAGVVAHSSGYFDDAVAWFNRARKLRPDHRLTLRNLGAAFCRAGRYAESVGAFDTILAMEDDCSFAHHGRGVSLFALGDREAALTALRKAVCYSPNMWRSWTSIGEITPHEDERVEAIERKAEALQRICRTSSRTPTLLKHCAEALIDARRYEDALDFLTSEASEFAKGYVVHDLRGRARYRQGNFSAAFNHQKQALFELPPDEVPRIRRPNRFNPAKAVEALTEVWEILEASRVRPFLMAGTLLGFQRNGGPLPHDRDIDIGVMADASAAPDIASILRKTPKFFIQPISREGDPYYTITYKGVGIDIFIHEVEGDFVGCRFTRAPGDIRWRFSRFELAEAEYNGRSWSIPDQPKRYLQEAYGLDWGTPDRGFASAISSPALFQVSPYARAWVSAKRANNCLRSGDHAKAEALIAQSPIRIASRAKIYSPEATRDRRLE